MAKASTNPFLAGRNALGVSQFVMAQRCEVTPEQISHWENDKTTPRLSRIETLANAYEVTQAEIREWITEQSARVLKKRMAVA